jgi:hypothetical protein
MRLLCSCAKKGGPEDWRRHLGNRACVMLRPRRVSLTNESLRNRVRPVRREVFNAKAQWRNDAKRLLTMPVPGTNGRMLRIEPMALTSLRIGVLASWRLDPGAWGRLRHQSSPIKPNQTKSNLRGVVRQG